MTSNDVPRVFPFQYDLVRSTQSPTRRHVRRRPPHTGSISCASDEVSSISSIPRRAATREIISHRVTNPVVKDDPSEVLNNSKNAHLDPPSTSSYTMMLLTQEVDLLKGCITDLREQLQQQLSRAEDAEKVAALWKSRYSDSCATIKALEEELFETRTHLRRYEKRHTSEALIQYSNARTLAEDSVSANELRHKIEALERERQISAQGALMAQTRAESLNAELALLRQEVANVKAMVTTATSGISGLRVAETYRSSNNTGTNDSATGRERGVRIQTRGPSLSPMSPPVESAKGTETVLASPPPVSRSLHNDDPSSFIEISADDGKAAASSASRDAEELRALRGEVQSLRRVVEANATARAAETPHNDEILQELLRKVDRIAESAGTRAADGQRNQPTDLVSGHTGASATHSQATRREHHYHHTAADINQLPEPVQTPNLQFGHRRDHEATVSEAAKANDTPHRGPLFVYAKPASQDGYAARDDAQQGSSQGGVNRIPLRTVSPLSDGDNSRRRTPGSPRFSPRAGRNRSHSPDGLQYPVQVADVKLSSNGAPATSALSRRVRLAREMLMRGADAPHGEQRIPNSVQPKPSAPLFAREHKDPDVPIHIR